MRKLLILFLCVCFMAVGFVGCANNAETANTTKRVTDMAGVTVEIPTEVNKVICISPTVTEYMIAFGLGDKLIGTHKNSLNKVWLDYVYPEISGLKAYSYSASAEEVLEVGADIVIVPQKNTAEELRNAGICALTIWLNDTEGSFSHIKILGEIFGDETADKIDQWIAEVQAVSDEINDVLDEHGVEFGPSVYMINGQSNKGLYYPQGGGGSALEGYLNSIRAYLSLHDFDGVSGNMPTEEEILKTNPEVITIGGAYGVPMKKAIESDPAWQNISAILNHRVYVIPIGGIGWDQGYIAMPVMLKFMANIFYPDIFDYDIPHDGVSFYKKYFDADITEQDITYMMQDFTPEGLPAWE